MSTWSRIAEYGKTTGVWEAGTRQGHRYETNGGHQVRRWDFNKTHERRLGRGFRAALNRMPMTEYKRIILDLYESYRKYKKLTDKEWSYLGLLMTKADPGCLENPKIKAQKVEKPLSEENKVILRKQRI